MMKEGRSGLRLQTNRKLTSDFFPSAAQTLISPLPNPPHPPPLGVCSLSPKWSDIQFWISRNHNNFTPRWLRTARRWCHCVQPRERLVLCPDFTTVERTTHNALHIIFWELNLRYSFTFKTNSPNSPEWNKYHRTILNIVKRMQSACSPFVPSPLTR